MSESGFPGCSRAPLTYQELAQSSCPRPPSLLGTLITAFETPAVAALLPSKTHRLSHAV
jgi:hypothetical protein